MSMFGAPNIERLAKRKDIDGLIKALSYHKDKQIQDNAALALVRLRDIRAVEPLIDILQSLLENDPNARIETVMWILGELGDLRAIKPLIEILDPEAFDPFIDIFSTKFKKLNIHSQRVLDGAVDALFKIGEPAFGVMVQARTVEPLIALLGETRLQNYKASVRKFRSFRNGKLLEPSFTIEEQKYGAQRKVAAIMLGMMRDDRAVVPLISELSFKDYRETAATALINLGRLAVEPLIAALKDPNGELRAISAELLGEIGDKRALESLIKVLKDKEFNVRKNAAAALGKIGDERAIEALLKVLVDKDINRTAANSLKMLGWKPGRDPQGVQFFVVQNAWKQVVEMGEPAIEPLITLLEENNDDNLRWAAAEALGQIRDQRAVDPLIIALKDPDTTLRENAAAALGKIGDIRTIPSLIATIQSEDNTNVKSCLVEALSSMGTPAVEPLINLLGSDRKLDNVVIKALGNFLADHRTVEPLITVIKDKDGDHFNRLQAAYALAKIGDARAVEPLITLLQGSDISLRDAAAQSLVDLYTSGKLNPDHKQRILAFKPLITKVHEDTHIDVYSCSFNIRDEGHSIPGTGVDFPL